MNVVFSCFKFDVFSWSEKGFGNSFFKSFDNYSTTDIPQFDSEIFDFNSITQS